MNSRRNKTAITSEDGVDTAIELILNAHRYASTGLDEANELPLHWLCRNVSATVNTVDEVWQAFPDAAAECAHADFPPISCFGRADAVRFRSRRGGIFFCKRGAGFCGREDRDGKTPVDMYAVLLFSRHIFSKC